MNSKQNNANKSFDDDILMMNINFGEYTKPPLVSSAILWWDHSINSCLRSTIYAGRRHDHNKWYCLYTIFIHTICVKFNITEYSGDLELSNRNAIVVKINIDFKSYFLLNPHRLQILFFYIFIKDIK